MSNFGKTAALAVASLFLASSAMATTLSITAMDIDNRGDDVMFTIVNNTDEAVSMITFDVAQAADQAPNARFNIPSRLSDGDGISGEGDSGIFEFINTDGDGDAEQLKWTFDNGGLAAGSSFVFNAWIQFLNDQVGPGLQGGLDVAGDRLFASVMFADGSTTDSFFTSLGAPGDVGKAQLDVAAVPLPASALLLMGGVAGLGLMRRKKPVA